MKYLLLISLLLVGCGHTPKDTVANTPTFTPVVCEDFGRIEPVRVYPVVFVEADDEDGNKVLGLRGDMYSNLSIIFRDSLRYIKEQSDVIDYYKKCIEDHNSTPLTE